MVWRFIVWLRGFEFMVRLHFKVRAKMATWLQQAVSGRMPGLDRQICQSGIDEYGNCRQGLPDVSMPRRRQTRDGERAMAWLIMARCVQSSSFIGRWLAEKEELMCARLIAVFWMMVLVPAGTAHADVVVAGEILLAGDSTASIRVLLVDEAAFDTPLVGYREVSLTVDAEAIERGRVSFRFDDLPAGRYGIRCFQDLDEDGQLGKGMFGPNEPWGMSWQGRRPLGWPTFEHIAFEAENDVIGLEIQLQP